MNPQNPTPAPGTERDDVVTTLPETSQTEDASATAQWWKSAVVYQIYPRSFADSNGDGLGDLPGIIAKLDYLATLGVDVIWLSPIYTSPQDDNGYDIANYQDIDPMFGTLDDFDRLLSQAHERGIKIVMDLVVNHTSDEHPWFIESRSSKDNPKRDWYWWMPPRDGFEPGTPGGEPTNWMSAFSGPAWAYDEATGEYFMHIFSGKQPDLNWENPEVRQAVYAMMNWWLDRGVDGFRMDVINLISKVLPLADGEPILGTPYSAPFDLVASGPRIHEFMQEMHASVFAGRDGQYLTVGETPGVTVEDAQLFTDPARAELDMVFQFEHVGLDAIDGNKFNPKALDVRELKQSLGRWQAGLADAGWNSLYWDNHDQPRIVSRWGDDKTHWYQSATMLAALLHLQRGTPYIYQGEELGMTNAPLATIEEFRDIEALNYYHAAVSAGADPDATVQGMRHLTRDNARTPVQWDDSAHGGFTEGTPWIDANPNFSTINAAAQITDENSVFSFYRKLIELRHENPVIAIGDLTMLAMDHPTLYAYTRGLDGQGGRTELLVLCNFSGEELAIQDEVFAADSMRDAWQHADIFVANYPQDDLRTAPLRPWEARVLVRTIK